MEQPKSGDRVEQPKEPQSAAQNGDAIPKAKKAYSTPTLTRYGSLDQLTHMVGNKGSQDNGSGNTSRTH